MTGRRFVVIGAGGHAKVVAATIEAVGGEIVAVLDDDPATHGSRLLGCRVDGPVSASLVPLGALVVIGVGTNRMRQALVASLGVEFATLVHPAAVVDRSVVLGPGTVVFAGAVVQPGSRVGCHVIINTSVSVDHDCVLGDFVHLAPGVHLAGEVTVSEGAFMGVGASAIPGTQIGAWATVGAGGVVIDEIDDGVTAVGVPARTIARRHR